MIYTVTLNPSIDFTVHVQTLRRGELNRMDQEQKYPGGKGINVSRILARIGVETTALGFVGGFTGTYLTKALTSEGVAHDFVRIDGDTRINIKLKEQSGETEINGAGPSIPPDRLQQFLQKLERLRAGDMLVLAGTIPPSLPPDLYQTLLVTYGKRGIKVVVDTSGEALAQVIRHHPFLIKPNHHELGELFNTTFTSLDETIPYGEKLLAQGIRHVIVSMADKGALLFTADGIYRSNVPRGTVVNSVGAGDSLVAGFIGHLSQHGSVPDAFRYGIATGGATAFSADLASLDTIETVYPQVQLTKL
ncbi:fructose-1-phosphate kinase [Laceyella tengchongensis]|uniref:Tagatose-6-phosphate kinase n=1 Tax=Laceyella tengchongensis TaxID=574699 RepID=A0AA45WQ20_9BACL|nr:1-phosphofructokinase [Laceyella tengchongensis]SMP23067.1 fructose-1-phosphate kinase [Laceyella tengchongensis]